MTTGNRLGGSSVEGMSLRERAAAAAQKRSENAGKQNMRIERIRYIGRIEVLYAKKHLDPPFGLKAASLPTLKKLLGL